MSLYNYVDTPNSNLICCICRAPFTDPTTARSCSHTFCSECILRALSHSPLCPVDRSPLTLNDLFPANPIVRSLVDELQVECVHKEEGCSTTCQRQCLATHLRDECEYAEVSCSLGCGKLVKRNALLAHVEEVHGEGDKEETKSDGMEPDMPKIAEEQTYTCPHASVGCPYRGTLQPEEHLPACPYESLKHFFSLNTAKIASLNEQNVILRHRVESLESTIIHLQREMTSAIQALGPWFRTSYSNGYPRNSDGFRETPSTDLPLGMQPASASSSTTGGTAFAETSLSAETFASYFPSEADIQYEQQARTHRSTSSNTATSAGGLNSNPHINPHFNTTSSTIAPLDLSSTLVCTFTGLRENLVSLATGLDSVSRRGEIALANETLRLAEEMMSVRAQMHGLRMQMHGIMLERNGLGGGLRNGEDGPGLGQGTSPFGMGILPPPRPPGMGFGVPSITKL